MTAENEARLHALRPVDKLPDPMPEPSLIQRERALLKRLASLVAERAHGEQSLDERRRHDTARAERIHSDSVAKADAEVAKARATLDAEHARAQERSEAESEQKLSAAKARMDRHIRSYNGRTVALGKAANREHEESRWLAETLVESGELKIRSEFELARKSIEKKLAEIKRARGWAEQLLADRRYAPMPVDDEPAADVDPPESRDQLTQAFDAARIHADNRCMALRSAVAPFLFGAVAIPVVMSGAAAAGGFAAYRWQAPATVETIVIWGLTGAIASLLIMLILRILVLRRVPRVAATTSEALAEARRAGERCMKKAQADRDRAGVELLARRDEELKKAERRMAVAKREISRRLYVDEARLRDRHSRRLGDIRARADAARDRIRDEFAARLKEAGETHRRATADAGSARAASMQELEDLDQSERGIIERHWKQGVAEVQSEVAAITGLMSDLCPPWADPSWDRFVGRDQVPPAVRLGSFPVDMAALPGGLSAHPQMRVPPPTSFVLPALLDLFDRGSLLIHAGKDPAAGARAVQLLKDVMLRLLTTFPPGKVRFTIIDPVGLGQNFAGFMHLADHDEQLIGAKIWTEPKHIEQRLTDLTEHMETVIQKYLRNEYETIQDYNREAGEVAEPYRFLVIADFPANLTEAAAKRLASIASSGARCGLYTLIASTLGEAKAKPPAWLPVGALEESSAVLRLSSGDAGRLTWKDGELLKWAFEAEDPPPEDRLTAMLHKVGAAAKDAARVQVAFEFVAPRPDQVWSLDASEEVRVPLGRAGAKALQYFTLGRGTAQHCLIAGRTGSGKSTLLHVLITNLALWYSPGQVELYLVDFKKGVEFKTYATHSLPHARVVAVESEREFGLSVLRRLDAELTRRGQMFREAGAQDVAGFRKSPQGHGVALPRVLLVVDEFQEFFVEDDKLAQEASLLLDRLVRQGRAFGMHVVLGSQTLGGAYSIARSTIGQMAVRIALQCSESDSYLIMSEDNAAARLLSRPGEAIYNDVSGRVEGNSLFQIVWLGDEKRERYLRGAYQRVRSNGLPLPPAPIVFEGNVPAELAKNQLLSALIDGRAAPGLLPRAWLGDAISIKDPTAAVFRRQSGSNLLIVGQHEDAAAAMLTAAVLGLAAHGPTGDGAARILVLDSTPSDSPHAALLEGVAARLPHVARFYRVRDAAAAVGEADAELTRREQSDRHDAPPVYLLINGIQRIRDLRKEDEFGFSATDEAPKTPAQQFARLLREGPPLGVHVLVWCDTATNVDRSLDRNALREFDSRVLLQMSAADSTRLIDAPTASTLGRNRALLHSEETGIAEKFRPYAPPDAEWLGAVLAKLGRIAPEPSRRQ